MAISKAEILDAVSAMTVLDLSELIKDMEENLAFQLLLLLLQLHLLPLLLAALLLQNKLSLL